MAYNEKLAARVRKVLARHKAVAEIKMFGGLCFTLRGNMCCGVERDKLVVRVGIEPYGQLLQKRHVKPMDFTGRPLRGFVYVMPEGLKGRKALKTWVGLALQHAESLPAKSATSQRHT